MGHASQLVGRRTVLRWAGSAVAVTVLAPPSPAAAAQPPTDALTVKAPPGGVRPLLVPGSAGPIEAPRALGVSLHALSPLAAGLRVVVEFDPRVYELAPDRTVSATSATGTDRPVRAGWGKAVTDPGTGLVNVPVTLGEAVEQGSTVTIVAGSVRTDLYPRDVIRDYRPVVAAVAAKRSDTGNAVEQRLVQPAAPEPSTPGSQPWGCEAGVLWQELRWGQGFRSWCARSASVISVGPGPVPAGYTVRVQADARLVRRLRNVSARTMSGRTLYGTARDISAGAVCGLEWTAAAELPPGEQAVIGLEVSPATPRGPLDGIKNPVVEVIGPRAHALTQRLTQRESVVRLGSRYDLGSARAGGE
jgi:hypothetical protein